MAKPMHTDHSIMKLAVAAEQHRKMNTTASATPIKVTVKQEDGRKPVIESTAKHYQRQYQGEHLITHKTGNKRKKYE